MRESLMVTGRRLVLSLEPGDEVLASIGDACRRHGFEQAVVVVLSGALRTARLIGTNRPEGDPELPLAVHVHVALGEKGSGARAVAGHLLSGTTHYVVEVVLDEVLSPRFYREATIATYGVPALTFAPPPNDRLQ